MPLSGNNLPSLDGQRYYTLVRQLTKVSSPETAYRCASHPLNKEECEHEGHSLSLIKHAQENITIKLQQYQYKVKCDEHGRYYVTNMTTSTRDIRYDEYSSLTELATEAFLFVCDPRINTYLAFRMLSRGDLFNSSYPRGYATFLEELLSEPNGFNIIDTRHVKTSFHVAEHMFAHLSTHVNSSYVNIVHDCERMCVQSVLNDTYGFMPTQDVQYYGLLCTHMLVDNTTTTAAPQRVATLPQSQNDSNSQVLQASVCLSVASLLLTGGAVAAIVSRSNGRIATRIKSFLSHIGDKISGIKRATIQDYSYTELQTVSDDTDVHESSRLLQTQARDYTHSQ